MNYMTMTVTTSNRNICETHERCNLNTREAIKCTLLPLRFSNVATHRTRTINIYECYNRVGKPARVVIVICWKCIDDRVSFDTCCIHVNVGKASSFGVSKNFWKSLFLFFFFEKDFESIRTALTSTPREGRKKHQKASRFKVMTLFLLIGT